MTPEATRAEPRWWAPVAILSAAVLVGHAPLGVLHLRSLWAQEQYQYFPFVLAAFAWLLYRRVQSAPPEASSAKGRAVPWTILLCSFGLLGLAVIAVSPWLAIIALNIALAAPMLWIVQQRRVTYLAGVWLLLWLLVPLPLGQDQQLVQYMQRLSSRMSSLLLDAMQILHVTAGNVVTLPDRELFVDEACSGIISVMSILACSVIYAVWRNRPPVHLVFLAVLSMIWAIFMNVARISFIAIAHAWLEVDLASGTLHEILGLCLYLVTFGALVCTDYLLVGLLERIPESEVGDHFSGNSLVRAWNRFVAWQSNPSEGNSLKSGAPPASTTPVDATSSPLTLKAAMCASLPFVLLGALQLIWVPTPDTDQARSVVDRAMKLNNTILPQRIGRWEVESYKFVEREAFSDFGRYSHTFEYRHAQNSAIHVTVSLDFPYLGGWHDLCVCYRNSGWDLGERVIRADDGRNPQWKFVETVLNSSDRGKATVLYAAFDVSGEPGEPASDAVLFRPWFRIRRRLLHQIAPQLLQVQVFAPMDATGNTELKRDLRELFVASRSALRAAVTGQ